MENSIDLGNITLLMDVFVSLGIKKIRLTGGEPLLRKDLEELIAYLRSLSLDLEIAITTNGVLLEAKTENLKSCGLNSINISLDSLNRSRFTAIVGRDCLEIVLKGIDAAAGAGFDRVGINVVVTRNGNYREVNDFIKFAAERRINIRFIELMETSATAAFFKDEFVPSDEVISRIASKIPLVPYEKADEETEWVGMKQMKFTGSTGLYGENSRAAGPARYFRVKGTGNALGFISPYSENFCDTCNRIRLDHRGVLYPCLFSSGVCDLGAIIKNGAGKEELREIVKLHVKGKKQARQDYLGSASEKRPEIFRLGG